MALVACMALCSLPVPLTIPVIPAHTPLPAICAQEAPKAIDLGVCVKWAAKDIGPEADLPGDSKNILTAASNIKIFDIAESDIKDFHRESER